MVYYFAGSAMECAGKAQRRRRFSHAPNSSRQKRCRARLPPHSIHWFSVLLSGFMFIACFRDGLKPGLQACASIWRVNLICSFCQPIGTAWSIRDATRRVLRQNSSATPSGVAGVNRTRKPARVVLRPHNETPSFRMRLVVVIPEGRAFRALRQIHHLHLRHVSVAKEHVEVPAMLRGRLNNGRERTRKSKLLAANHRYHQRRDTKRRLVSERQAAQTPLSEIGPISSSGIGDGNRFRLGDTSKVSETGGRPMEEIPNPKPHSKEESPSPWMQAPKQLHV